MSVCCAEPNTNSVRRISSCHSDQNLLQKRKQLTFSAMPLKAIEETIGQGPNLQCDVPEEVEEANGAEGDNNGGLPEGNGERSGVLELANDQGENSGQDEVGEATPPRAPMPREDQSLSMEPQGDSPSVSRPPTPEESSDEEGDGASPPKKFKC
ncbi:uncharacterized protein [Drosophila takahashii]|uniref:uncharacterized protein n=1 Tax=Drosophila takahashii TaxID=29030 RepID=UPI0038993242